MNKNVNTNNIEYVCGENNERDEAFAMNGMKDLLLRGYNSSDLPRGSAVRQSMLLACLMTQRKIRTHRNALKNNKDALAKQLLNPGILACCILLAKMRRVEKFIQQLILSGMRKNPTGSDFDEYCDKVEDVDNCKILGRTTPNTKNCQWKVPLVKTNGKKLGDECMYY